MSAALTFTPCTPTVQPPLGGLTANVVWPAGTVRPSTGTVATDFVTYQAAPVNALPAQSAGQIPPTSGLANDTGFWLIRALLVKTEIDTQHHVLQGGRRPR